MRRQLAEEPADLPDDHTDLLRLRDLTDSIRAAKKLDLRMYRERIAAQLDEAWDKRDLAEAHRLARALTGKNLGPKMRRHLLCASQVVTTQEWVEYFCQAPSAGGCDAEPSAPPAPPAPRDDELHHVEASDVMADYHDVGRADRRCRLRAGVPRWSAPASLWRVVFHPNFVPVPRASVAGVGSDQAPFASLCPQFSRAIFGLFATVRRARRAPEVWHDVQLFFASKNNAKVGPPGMRALAMLDPVGKCFFRALWRRGRPQSERSWAYGYASGKSREMAVASQLILGVRLAKQGNTAGTVMYDMQNAFWCTKQASMRDAVRRVARPIDVPFFDQRIASYRMQTRSAGDEAWVRVGAGAPPGDSFAAQIFSEVYNPCLDAFIEQTQEDAVPINLWWLDEQPAQFSDVTLTSYADDIARKFVCTGAGTFHYKLVVHADALDRAVGAENYSQNRTNREALAKFVGAGATRNSRRVYREDPHRYGCRLRVFARYLDTLLRYNHTNSDERALRAARARSAWAMYAKFWFAGPRRFAVLVFKGLVLNTLWSGWAALVPTSADLKLFDALLHKWGRALMRGAASSEVEGARHYKGHMVVHRFLRVASSEVELRIRRLRMWQTILRDIDRYDALLALYFGNGDMVGDVVDNDGQLLADAHPWARLLHDDLRSLDADDDLASLVEHWGGSAKVFLCDRDFRDRFCRVDFACLRARFLSQAVPDFAPPPQARDPPLAEEERPFSCRCLVEGGGVCGASFPTWRSLSVHMRQTRGGTHGGISARQIVFSNVCPVCGTRYASVELCRRHYQRSVASKRCRHRGGRSVQADEIVEGGLVCRICVGPPFSSSADLRLHLLTVHVPPELVEASAGDLDVDIRP